MDVKLNNFEQKMNKEILVAFRNILQSTAFFITPFQMRTGELWHEFTATDQEFCP